MIIDNIYNVDFLKLYTNKQLIEIRNNEINSRIDLITQISL